MNETKKYIDAETDEMESQVRFPQIHIRKINAYHFYSSTWNKYCD